jgi:hypothetical protein
MTTMQELHAAWVTWITGSRKSSPWRMKRQAFQKSNSSNTSTRSDGLGCCDSANHIVESKIYILMTQPTFRCPD